MVLKILKLIQYKLKYLTNHKSIFWFQGVYNNWEDAEKNSQGYNSADIFEKVKESALKVKSGDAVFERDSFLFHKLEFSYPLSVYLLFICSQLDNSMQVLDFGGSLGSTYFQNKSLFSAVKNLKWIVIEQEYLVSFGQKELEDEKLVFCHNIGTACKFYQPNIALLSSSIQYIEQWQSIIGSIIDSSVSYIIIDRTPFDDSAKKSYVTIQNVPKEIYEASYPCHIFSKIEFDSIVLSKFEEVFNLPAFDKLKLKGFDINYRAILYKRKVA